MATTNGGSRWNDIQSLNFDQWLKWNFNKDITTTGVGWKDTFVEQPSQRSGQSARAGKKWPFMAKESLY